MDDYFNAIRSDKDIKHVSKKLAKWLKKTDWQQTELTDWLQGYKLPPVGYDNEPYLWMFWGVCAASENNFLKEELAQRLIKLLRVFSDLKLANADQNEIIYNLFMLCSELRYKNLLANPLREIYEQIADKKQRHPVEKFWFHTLKREWRGIDLRYAFKTAIAHNQIDDSFEPIWLEMLKGKTHRLLMGHEYDGFDGILYMPPATGSNAPNVEKIGYALRLMANYLEAQSLAPHPKQAAEASLMANYLETNSNFHAKFRALIEKVKKTYPDHPSWDVDLIHQAHNHDFPWWAVDSLKLYVPISTSDDGSKSALLWNYTALCIPESFGYEVRNMFCGGRVVEVNLQDKAKQLIDSIAVSFENARINNPDSSKRSVIGVVVTAMVSAELIAFSNNDFDTIKNIQRARKKILDSNGIRVNVKTIITSINNIVKFDHSESSKVYKARNYFNWVETCSTAIDSKLNIDDVVEQAGRPQVKNLIKQATEEFNLQI